jgi:hypothetical protein
MTQEDIIKLAREACEVAPRDDWNSTAWVLSDEGLKHFAAIVAAHERKVFIEILETYRIPVGNSRSGELACEWTYRALHEIRDEIKARGEQ